MGLSITFDDDRTKVNILNLTHNLNTALYISYDKTLTNLKYTTTFSNLLTNIVKQLMKNISLKISKLSTNVNGFNNNADFYNSAL